MTLEQLKEEERALNEKLRVNKALQRTILEANFMLKTGISVGDLVEIIDKKIVISGFRHGYYGPSFTYRKILKDGFVGKDDIVLGDINLKHSKVVEKGYMNPEDF